MAKVSAAKRHEMEEKRQEISRLYLKGWSQFDIGKRFGCTKQNIGKQLKVIENRWIESSLYDLDKAKARELAKVDELERTYYDAWERSKETHETTNTQKAEGGTGAKLKAVIRRELRDGNPAFLAGVQWCIERRCRILGIDAPTKIAPTDPTGEHEYHELTDAERATRVDRLLDAARERRAGQAVDGTPGDMEP